MEFDQQMGFWLKGSPVVEFDHKMVFLTPEIRAVEYGKKMVLLAEGLTSTGICPKDGAFGSKAHQEWNLTKRWCFWLQGL